MSVILVLTMALVENLLMAIATITARAAVRHVPATVLVGYRGVLISLAILVYTLLSGQWQPVDWRTWTMIATGALSGPFLGHVMYDAALSGVGAGRVAVITALQPVFVTLYTMLLFGDVPTALQAAGGALSIAGVLLVLGAHYRPFTEDVGE